MLISTFNLENGTVIAPLVNFYLKLAMQFTKVYSFVQYSPQKNFNKCLQSVVDVRREREKNTLSGFVVDTMELHDNSSIGYQVIDRSRHTITNYLNDG